MIIGFDAKRAFVNKSGLGNYSRDIIRSLHDFYPDNTYLLFSPEKNFELLEEKYCKNVILPKSSTKIGKSYWRSFQMGQVIEENKADIFHGLSNELPFDIKKTKALKVVTIHDLIFIKFPQLYSYADRKIYYRKFYKSCINADKIVATSNQTKEDIIKYFRIPANKIEVIYQSCNSLFSEENLQFKHNEVRGKYNLPEKYILTVGTIERRKNALNVVKAIYYFNLDVNYLIAGRRTPYCDEIIAYAREHNISDRIFVREDISNSDLPIIYNMAEVFVYPSIYEGFGIPVIEAFNAGVAVITGDGGSTAEIGGSAAIQVDVLNPKNIGVAIRAVLESDELKNQLIADGRTRAKLFDGNTVCNNMMNFYNRL
jgi:glycosyltransferase involved in cell wall biosynthesis